MQSVEGELIVGRMQDETHQVSKLSRRVCTGDQLMSPLWEIALVVMVSVGVGSIVNAFFEEAKKSEHRDNEVKRRDRILALYGKVRNPGPRSMLRRPRKQKDNNDY